jgi:hypothetical protein
MARVLMMFDGLPGRRGDDQGARRWPSRKHVVPPALGILSLVISGVFVGVSLSYNQGRLIPPLDDVYIHLQYGRQIGAGQFFRYNTGDPISTGASSVLYALILGLAWFGGLHGGALLWFAVGFGLLCLAVTTVLAHALGRTLIGPAAGVWAGLLVACSGPLVWGATSGMEVGLAAVAVTALVYAFVCEQPRRRYVATPLIGVLAALVRPEVWVFACIWSAAIWLSVIVGHRRRQIPLAVAVRGLVLGLAPLLAGTAQLAFYRVVTGTTSANGVQSKSLLTADTLWPTELADQAATNLRGYFALLSGLSNQDFALPGALGLAVLGVFALALGEPRRRLLAVAWGFGMLVSWCAIATLRTAPWQNVRYLQPFLGLFVLLVILGVHAVAQITTRPDTRRMLLHAGLSLALLFNLAMLPTWAVRLGEEAATIRDGPVSIAHWLKTHIPPEASIGVNDVGATAYFSGHRIVDLMGLTTNGMASPTNSGPGTMYEALRHMPATQRPNYFSVYNSWPGPPVHKLANAGVLGKPLMTFRLDTPYRPEPGLQTVCESDHSCARVSVYHADWSLAGSGDLPHTPTLASLRDYLNVGDLAAESRHHYQVDNAQVGLQPLTVLRTVTYPNGQKVADSGRRIVGGETFTLTHLIPGRPLQITTRTQPRYKTPIDTQQLQIVINNHPAGTLTLPQDPLGWHETTLTVPANLVTTTAQIELRPFDPLLAPFPAYTSFGYWASQ